MPQTRPVPVRALVIVGIFWSAYVAILWAGGWLKPLVPVDWGPLVWGGVCALAITAVTLALARRDQRTPADVGLRLDRWSGLWLLAGLGIGTAVYAGTVALISWLVTPIHLDAASRPAPGAVALVILGTFALAAMEELGFRGYPLRTLQGRFGHWRSQVIVALAFGLSHIAFGWGWQPVVFGVLPSALLFGAVAAASGELMMPTGVHAAFNLGRIATGETSTPGLWTIRVDDAAIGALASQAPVIGLLCTLFAAAMVWPVNRLRRAALHALAHCPGNRVSE